MDMNIAEFYTEYRNGTLDRREFLNRLAAVAGGATGAFALLARLENGEASAQTIQPDDPRLRTEYIQYPAATGEMRAYSAQPIGEAKLPGVVVIHENRGLNPHIEDVARRFALEGYLTIAPDALSPVGGTPADPNEAGGLFAQLDNTQTVRNFVAAVKYLKTNPRSTGKVGVTGFCWGGGMTNQVAVNSPDLDAAVPFYGAQPSAEDVPKIKAAMLLHYAGDDARIDAGIPAFEAALKAAKVEYTLYMYEGAGHAFFNDTGARYNEAAAKLAWQRTLTFFNEKLKT